jgi:PAS domain-containing protein
MLDIRGRAGRQVDTRPTKVAPVKSQERQRIEQALRESQERYRQFLQMTSEGVARYEARCAVVHRFGRRPSRRNSFSNTRAWSSATTHTRGNTALSQATDAVGLRLADAWRAARRRNSSPGAAVHPLRVSARRNLEAPDKHRSGQVIWTRNSLVGVVENHHLVRAWVMQQDITQRRLIEERIREQAQMLDLAHDAIFIRDLEDRVLYWNESAQKSVTAGLRKR